MLKKLNTKVFCLGFATLRVINASYDKKRRGKSKIQTQTAGNEFNNKGYMNVLQKEIKRRSAMQATVVALAVMAGSTLCLPARAGMAATGLSGNSAAGYKSAAILIGDDNGSTTAIPADSLSNEQQAAKKRQQALIDSLMSEQTLDDVVVTSQRQLVKVDAEKLTYDIQADEEAKTKTVMDMLKKVPLVTVDGQDNITVKGSSDFKIYKNGHPDPSLSNNAKDVLKAIPASSIKKIEVITEPGAKYDAEGVTAILNIVMADGSSMNGVTATLQTQISNRGPMASGYIAAQAGKFAVSANYGMFRQNGSFTTPRSTESMTYGDTGNTLTNRSEMKQPATVNFLDLNTSYELDSLNLFTLSGSGFFFTLDLNGTTQTAMTAPDGSPIYKYNSTVKFPGYNYHNWNGRFDWQHKTHREGEMFTLSYMLAFTKRRDNEQVAYENILNMPMNYNGYAQSKHEYFSENTVQADYVRPLSEHHKIETGAKYIYRLNRSNTAMDYDGAEDENTMSVFRHTTHVAALYAQYMLNVGRWSARAGLRYEYSRLQAEFPDGMGEKFHRNLNDWVPSANVQYKFSDANSLKLSFATSIRRPGIDYLNPAVIETPTSVSFGNATLSSSRRNMLGLTYTHTGAKLTYNINPYYRFSNDNITGIEYLENGKKYSTYANALRGRNAGVSAFVQCQPWKGNSTSINGSVNYDKVRNPNIALSNSGWNGDVFVNISQKLPWKLNLSLGGGGKIGHDVSNVYGYNGTWYYSYISLQRSFLKDDRLSVNIGANNPIGSKYSSYRSGNTQGDFTSISCWENKQKSFSVGISLRLGKLSTSVKKTEKTIENEDVVGGIKQK